MAIRRVQQEHPMGCGVACVAMVTGQPYQEVAALLSKWDGSKGTTHTTIQELLHHYGFAHSILYSTCQFTNERREVWPGLPFADAGHIVSVDSPIGAHYVVWLRNGVVLDPARDGYWKLSDYGRAHHIIGVYPVQKMLHALGEYRATR
jgi:ABC-type bacteriocin/lantibiotic exporter with double-glycine peptidase domain